LAELTADVRLLKPVASIRKVTSWGLAVLEAAEQLQRRSAQEPKKPLSSSRSSGLGMESAAGHEWSFMTPPKAIMPKKHANPGA